MAQSEALKRYRKRTVKHCGFDLNRNTDADLIAHLEEQPNRAEYLKRLIREDMERSRS